MKAHIQSTHPYRLSACTIAKNEENTIARSIDSYRYFVDEIIVVDTGSTDDTVRVAQEHGARVLHFDWCGDFSAAKNFALDHAGGDWILFLDADEYFCEGCGERVREVVALADMNQKNAIFCRLLNIEKTGALKSELGVLRFFKAGAYYQYAVHESVAFSQGIRAVAASKDEFFLYHTGYSSEIFPQKVQRNIQLLQHELEECQELGRIAALHAYLSDCYLVLDDLPRVIEHVQAYETGAKQTNLRMVGLEGKPYLNVIALLEKHDASTDEIAAWVEKVETAYPEVPDSAYASARLCVRRRLFLKAQQCLERALDYAANADEDAAMAEMTVLRDQNTVIAYLQGVCAEAAGDPARALSHYLTAAKHENINRSMVALLRLIKCQSETDQKKFAEYLYTLLDEEHRKLLLGAAMLLYMPGVVTICGAAALQQGKSLDANIMAFVQAGNGDYAGASRLFYTWFEKSQESLTAMRALLCAVLAQDENALEHAKTIAPFCYQAVLGLIDKPVTQEDIPQIAVLAAEAYYLKGDALSAKIAHMAVQKIGASFAKELAEKLEQLFVFAAALAAVESSPLQPDTLFLRGYYTYRIGRFGEAEDHIRLAKAWGYAEPDADATLELIARQLRAFRADKQPDMQSEQKRVAKRLEQGEFAVAHAALDMLRELAEPDAQWYSMEAVALYYLGQDEQAALAVQTGLLRFPNDADLAYNAGDIFKRMGLQERAQAYYQQALAQCKDSTLGEQIRQAMETVSG